MSNFSLAKTELQQDSTDGPTNLPALVPNIDAYALACLDLGRQLPRLHDNVKEAVLELLPSKDLARCLLASKLSYSWCHTKHYLSEVRLGLQFECAIGKLPMMRQAVQDTCDVLREHKDAVAAENNISELVKTVEECYNGIASVIDNAKLYLAEVMASGCNRYLWWKFSHIQDFAKTLLESVSEQRQVVWKVSGYYFANEI